ncbi:peptidoglycan-binding protein [Allorhizobium sp. BGMRC 0089]|uniref:peptidoglycan-binding protein n=1 Tax=Allorhizobium sonneratiae TaxID=2934936 RepID=UPI002034827E|nr:peptidoglycan-binding protein [Allorhizobium sonneratiae]MCM2291076.1 peptidoglycan-binding protein [Allorhizobium sonneratiae]
MSPTLLSRLDASVLKAIAPTPPSKKAATQRAIIIAFGAMLPELLTLIDCTTPLRIAHFLAQVAHESDGFCTLEEYASGAAYEGRTDLGNVRPGDGVRYKGRGPIQLTGRANYRAFTSWMRRIDPTCADFEARPELVATWPWAGWAAAFFWERNTINTRAADLDDLVKVTRIVNGGRNGLEDRRRYLGKAKTAIATLAADQLSGVQLFPVLRRGMEGEAVEQLQRALASAGYYHLSIDGDFGPGTEGALRIYQGDTGLTVDGIAGKNTFASLQDYWPEED